MKLIRKMIIISIVNINHKIIGVNKMINKITIEFESVNKHTSEYFFDIIIDIAKQQIDGYLTKGLRYKLENNLPNRSII